MDTDNMDTFENNQATIMGTIYGSELKRAIRENLMHNWLSLFVPANNLSLIEDKVKKLEERGG